MRSILSIAAVVVFTSCSVLTAQELSADVWKITWRSVATNAGTTWRVPTYALNEWQPVAWPVSVPKAISEVVTTEERLRIARLTNDMAGLSDLVSDGCYGMLDGQGFNRYELLEAFRATHAASVEQIVEMARGASGTVVLNGEEYQSSGGKRNRVSYVRVYSRQPGTTRWRLVFISEVK